MNDHNRPHDSQEDISMLGDLDTSLLARWKNVLHEIGDRDGEQTIEDQHLTAVLGMAIGHTRRLNAHFTSEALGTNLHEKKLRHMTGLEAASIKIWPHNMGLRALTTSDQNSKIINVRVVRHYTAGAQRRHWEPVNKRN